jgi:aldose sugar dehydrogenase
VVVIILCMLSKPLLKVPVATKIERGMLGIAIAKNESHTYVFLYYTQSGGGKNDDDRPGPEGGIGIQPLGNRLYRYDLVGNELVNPKLLLNLPAIPANPISPETNHNGGKVVIGPDRNVYTIIGDVGSHRGQAQNIRNSFGIAFDPLSGKLWDTENGEAYGDEINLVNPGFNSGWVKIQGIWQTERKSSTPGPVAAINPSNLLVDFGGNGKYRAPEFSWLASIAPTALTFLNSSKLGKQYENDMFVADVLYSNIYDFKLNQSRTGLLLNGTLDDKVANTPAEDQPLIFAHGFGGITDIQVGPDGYLYVLSYTGGAIYRIVPSS